MAYIPQSDLTACYVLDVPAQVTLDFYDETGNPAPTNNFDAHTAYLIYPDGDTVTLTSAIHDGHSLHVNFPTSSVLTVPGVYAIQAVFTHTSGQDVTTDPYQFPVLELDGWLTLEQARRRWPDAPVDDVVLYELLDVARTQCQAYAPALLLGAVVPATYREAQYLQARAIFMASISNQADSVGVDGYQVRSFPLDWNIRALLRPKKAIGGMF